ncbi:MAG: hypothetical protein V4671_12185, partial [Armatimonadota bacterium]
DVAGRGVEGEALRLLLTWAVVGIAVSYIPISFQRKMLMGAHIPWAILAGCGLAALAARLSGDFPKIAIVTAVALAMPSNALFLNRDIGRLQINVGSTPHRPYLTNDEDKALTWLRQNTKPSDTVLVSPDPTSHLRFPGNVLPGLFLLYPHLSVYVPAYAGNIVYDGHWSETPSFVTKLGKTRRFFRAETDDAFRQNLLQENRIRYILYVNALGSGPLKNAAGETLTEPSETAPYFVPVPWPQSEVPPYLSPVYQNDELTIFAVDPTKLADAGIR